MALLKSKKKGLTENPNNKKDNYCEAIEIENKKLRIQLEMLTTSNRIYMLRIIGILVLTFAAGVISSFWALYLCFHRHTHLMALPLLIFLVIMVTAGTLVLSHH